MLGTSSLQDAPNELDFTSEIDLFASRINTQFPKCVSFKPDPTAFAIDAFTLDWSRLMFYALNTLKSIFVELGIYEMANHNC